VERTFKRSLNRKVHKLVTKRLRLDRVNAIVTQQCFTDSDSTDDVESTTSCKSSCQSSEDDGHNIVHED